MNRGEPEGARRLPPGRHGLSPQLVERNQRERLIAAMAEVCAERGYADSSVAEIASRAGVSTASFYRQFKHRRECMLASFEELFARLLEAIERACATETDRGTKARAGVRTAAELLASDPPATRLLSIEILAVGTEGVRLQHEAVDRLAARLRESREAAGAPSSPDAAWTTVVSMLALVTRRIAEDRGPDPGELEGLIKSS